MYLSDDLKATNKGEFSRQVAEGLKGRYDAKGDVQENRWLRIILDGREHSVLEMVPAITVQPGRVMNSLRKAGWIIGNRLDHSTGKKHSFYTLRGWERPVAAANIPVGPKPPIGTAPMFTKPLVVRMD